MLTYNYSVAVNPQPPLAELSVLFSGQSQTEPNHRVGPQVLDYYLIHYIQSGHGKFTCRDQVYSLRAGDSFVIHPGELVSYHADEFAPWCYRWVAFTGEQAGQLVEQVGLSTEHPTITVQEIDRLEWLFAEIQRVLKIGHANCSLRSDGYLRLILAEYQEGHPSHQQSRAKSEAELQVEKAIRWLTLQYARPLTISELARDIGYHRTHLSKLFKDHTGYSPQQYLLKIRMERAADLLQQEDMTIQHIASSVGYTDALYFSRQFKQWYGVSPSAYRAR